MIDASLTQSSLGTAAKQLKFEYLSCFLVWFIVKMSSLLKMKRLMVSRLDSGTETRL